MKTLSKLIGNTRVVELSHIGHSIGTIFLKMSLLNPSGSIKDVMAAFMLAQAEKKKLIKPGGKILEATTGNTGISFSMLSSVKGYEFIAVMPEHMSIERRQMMRAFGTRIVLTPRELDMQGAIDRFNELKEVYPDAWLPDQFSNQDNIDAHRRFTGSEILKQVPGAIDYIVAGVGTGGTLIGSAMAIKERYPGCKVVAVEPHESSVLSGGSAGLHGIQGIGEGFVPPIIQHNRDLIDQVVPVSTAQSMDMCKRLAQDEGIMAGPSTGANLFAAIHVLEQNKGAQVVTIAPDRGERYLNQGLYGCSAVKCKEHPACYTQAGE